MDGFPIRVDALDLLKDSDFAEGREEFVRLLAHAREKHLSWPEIVPFVEWVYHKIKLTAQESSRSGNMRLSVYQREIGNSVFHDPACRQVSVLKGVQIGYSKLLRVIYAYAVAVLAKRVAIAFPVTADMVRFLKDEILTLYERVKEVGGIVRQRKLGQAADTSNEHRYSNGAQGYFRAAFNEDDLQGFTSWLQIADEADRDGWQPRGASAGDKVSQFRNRGTDFHDSKLIIGSTPGIRETSVIWKEWETSDKRKLFVTCPHCGTEQELRWGTDKTRYGFRWRFDDKGHVEEAWYQCDSESRCKIDEDTDKEAMIDAGVYHPTAIPTKPGNVGIHAPSWISMSPGARWKVLAQKWVEAQKAKAEGNLDLLKEFVTFNMAEPWDDISGTSHDPEAAASLQVAYPAEVPDDVIVLTCGVDMQDNKEGIKGGDHKIASREVTVYGWNSAKKYRAICHHIVLGEVGDPDSDAELDAIRLRGYRKRDGTVLIPQATAHDMGSSEAGRGDAVKAYCAARRMQNCWAIKGRNGALGTRSASVWPKRVSRNPKAGTTWYMIDTQQAKDVVGRQLRIRPGTPGAPMFPASFGPDFFEGLTAEGLVTDKKGRRYWKRKGSNTGEEWDCLVYAYAALCGLQASFPKWRNLNLAAKRQGVPDVPHDPETGELDYDGPDRSVQAGAEPDGTAAAGPAASNGGVQPKAPGAEPPQRQGTTAKRKKVRTSRVLRSTRW